MNVRKTAWELLCRAESENRFVNLSLTYAFDSDTSEEDKALLAVLLYGTTEKRLSLDYYICALSGRSGDKIEAGTKNILRLGLYQLMYMDKIPSFAAVNESVKLARNKGEAAFVNAVLRSYERKKDTLLPPPREKNEARHLSVKYSFPIKTVKHFISEYGVGEAEQILSAFCKTPPLSLRVNTLKISRDGLLELFKENRINAEPDRLAPNGILLHGRAVPSSLVGFEEGFFYVQDTASQLECEVLGAEAGDLIIDVCACPGGKSFGAAISANDRAKIVAFDIHGSKLSLVKEGAERLGLKSIEAYEHDSRKASEEYREKADKVICDLPCSGLGVLAKKPDLRYRETDIDELCALSSEIFDASAEYVKRGGVLLFSTCTLNSRENEDALEEFLERHPDFVREDFSVGVLKSENGMLTLLPHIHGCDGFFIAKVRRGTFGE